MTSRDALMIAIDALLDRASCSKCPKRDIDAAKRLLEIKRQKGEFRDAYPDCTQLTDAIDTYIDG